MIPERCATCPRQCWQFLAYLESVALDEQGPLADPRLVPRARMNAAMPPAGAWQHLVEARLDAA